MSTWHLADFLVAVALTCLAAEPRRTTTQRAPFVALAAAYWYLTFFGPS